MPTTSQRGQILPVFCLLLALLILPVGGLAVDGGVLLSSHASLVGAAQAAAEGAAQAVDVTALEHGGAFQLCIVPDGSATCGNGIGTVGQVVDESITAIYQDSPASCVDYGTSQLPSALPPGAGCAFDVMSNCQRAGEAPSSIPLPADGVAVVIWQTIQLPLLVFPGWTSVKLHATSAAWMEHGFASQAIGVGGALC
jgi:hypothetical protein